jgi:hypothetical protein
MSSKPKVIKGDDDDIGYKVLAWAGADELWFEYSLGDHHDPYSDVVTWCSSLDIDSEDYDVDRPGASGTNYVITIGDPAKAKAEILARIRELIVAREK